jgi:hypothetical protein
MMDKMPIAGHDPTEDMARYLLSRYDVPAYVRRARHVEDTSQDLLAHCSRQREEWLEPVRSHLALVWALFAGAPQDVTNDEALGRALRELQAILEPPVTPTPLFSSRLWRRALLQLREEIERFNRLWRDFLNELDLMPINRAREDYNRYYLLEKECAVRSMRLASRGYRPLDMMCVAELQARWPLLPEAPI